MVAQIPTYIITNNFFSREFESHRGQFLLLLAFLNLPFEVVGYIFFLDFAENCALSAQASEI